MSIVAESPGFIQVFSNGVVKRFTPPTAAADECSDTTTTLFKSKDVIIDQSKPITARIFLPHHRSPPQTKPIPILVYFHGGGFCIGSTTWLGYHTFLGKLSATADILVLSVDYRLAPEHKLPIAYDDCYASLQWLAGGSNSEPWLQQGDLSRIFLSGDSAGGNIAHHVALKAMETGIIRIKGVLAIHPYFGSEERTELEMAEGSAGEVAMNDMFWKLSLPEGSDRDYYGCNIDKESHDEWGHFPAVVVFVAGMDFLRERGVMYAEFLKKKGVENVRLVEAEEESHVFHAWNPDSTPSFLLQKQIASFIQAL